MSKSHRNKVVIGIAALSFLAPLKFTEAAVLHHLTPWPSGLANWIFQPWPIVVFHVLWVMLLAAAVMVAGKESWSIRWGWMPLGFLVAQCFSTGASVDATTSGSVLGLFFSLAAAFWLGARMIRDRNDLDWLAFGWLAAGVLVTASGLIQLSVGFEAMERMVREHPSTTAQQTDLLHRLEMKRIFATFTSPNALGAWAAAALFIGGWWCWNAEGASERRGRRIVGAAMSAALFFCLWKSQSRASLAVFVILASAAFIWSTRRSLLTLLVPSVICFGLLTIFYLWHGHGSVVEWFETSGSSRLAYYKAAAHIGCEHPLLGTGPGTFQAMYPRYKSPEAEETRLVHNNYLQMWSDSGLPGFVTFALWLPGTLLLWLRRWRLAPSRERISPLLIWCACAVFALHSLVDYDLYMAGNSWPIFVLLGYLSQSEPTAAGNTRPNKIP